MSLPHVLHLRSSSNPFTITHHHSCTHPHSLLLVSTLSFSYHPSSSPPSPPCPPSKVRHIGIRANFESSQVFQPRGAIWGNRKSGGKSLASRQGKWGTEGKSVPAVKIQYTLPPSTDASTGARKRGECFALTVRESTTLSKPAAKGCALTPRRTHISVEGGSLSHVACCVDLFTDVAVVAEAVAKHVSSSWAIHLKQWASANPGYVKQINITGGHAKLCKILDKVVARHKNAENDADEEDAGDAEDEKDTCKEDEEDEEDAEHEEGEEDEDPLPLTAKKKETKGGGGADGAGASETNEGTWCAQCADRTRHGAHTRVGNCRLAVKEEEKMTEKDSAKAVSIKEEEEEEEEEDEEEEEEGEEYAGAGDENEGGGGSQVGCWDEGVGWVGIKEENDPSTVRKIAEDRTSVLHSVSTSSFLDDIEYNPKTFFNEVGFVDPCISNKEARAIFGAIDEDL